MTRYRIKCLIEQELVIDADSPDEALAIFKVQLELSGKLNPSNIQPIITEETDPLIDTEEC